MTDFRKNLSEEAKITLLEALNFVLLSRSPKNSVLQDYLKKQTLECSMPVKTLKEIQKIKDSEELINLLKKIPDKKTKRFILREMIMMTVIDHELTDEEMCKIYRIGTGIGIKQDKINDFFFWAAKGIEWQIEGAHLVEDD